MIIMNGLNRYIMVTDTKFLEQCKKRLGTNGFMTQMHHLSDILVIKNDILVSKTKMEYVVQQDLKVKHLL